MHKALYCRRLDFCNGVLVLGRSLQHKLGALKLLVFILFVIFYPDVKY